MSIPASTSEAHVRAYSRRLAPGLREQHDATCLKSVAWPRTRCSCTVTYDAWIRRVDADEHRTFATRDAAERWLADQRRATRELRGDSALLLSDAAAQFLDRAVVGASRASTGHPYRTNTIQAYRRALRLRVLPHHPGRGSVPLGDRSIARITPAMLQGAVDAAVERYGSDVARITCSAIRALFVDLTERGDLDAALPLPRLPERNLPAPRLAYSADEVERILRAARADDDRHDRSLLEPLIVLILGSGASVRAALRTRWAPDSLDVDARTPRVCLERPSTRHGLVRETVGLAPPVAAILRRHRDRLPHVSLGSPVFPSAAGDRPATTLLVHAALRRIGVAADVARLSPYALRHTGAAWADQADTDPLDPASDAEEARR